jgi:hypothetical protein
MSERRKYSRVNFQGHCSLVLDNVSKQRDFDASLIDISFKGALVSIATTEVELINEALHLHLKLEGSDITLLLNGIVSHQHEHFIGINFTTIDIDSMTHLKRIIEFNIGSDEDMHREFDQLIEQHIAES